MSRFTEDILIKVNLNKCLNYCKILMIMAYNQMKTFNAEKRNA